MVVCLNCSFFYDIFIVILFVLLIFWFDFKFNIVIVGVFVDFVDFLVIFFRVGLLFFYGMEMIFVCFFLIFLSVVIDVVNFIIGICCCLLVIVYCVICFGRVICLEYCYRFFL